MMPDSPMRQQLRSAFLFSRLDAMQLERVVTMARYITLDEGVQLFEAGAPARQFFLVTFGQIKLTRLAPNGNEKVIEVITPGNTFAEALMFSDTPTYPVTATALGRCELIAIDNSAFTALLRESVDTCFRMMSDMSQRLHRMIKEIDDLTLQSAIGRVAGYLIGKSTLEGKTHELIELDLPKGIIASRLSITPETLSRILSSFSTQGMINVSGSRIAILDRDALLALARSAATTP